MSESSTPAKVGSNAGLGRTVPAHDLLQRLRDERDLCAAEHADDIANLLHEAVLHITTLQRSPLDPYRIEELWDKANEEWGASVGGPHEYVLFARAVEREHGIAA